MSTTRVYRYGLFEPTEGAEIVDRQMRLAHAYQNELVSIELWRRDSVRAILAGSDPGIARLDEDIKEAGRRLGALRDAVQEERTGTKRAKQNPEGVGAVKAAKAVLSALYRERKERVRAFPKDQLKPADEEANTVRKATRAAYRDKGLYWGTGELIDQAADQARKEPTGPRRKRWTGEGAVGARRKTSGDRIGTGVDDAVRCDDTAALRLDLITRPVHGRKVKPIPRVRLRVASDNRSPVWAEWPVSYHRPLPPEARVMGVKVVRRRIASKLKWSLHVTLRLADDWTKEPCGAGTVAVDLGWAATAGIEEAVTTRAGRWLGEDGAAGEVTVHPRVVGALAKAADLRSIREKNVNALRPRLAEYLAGAPASHRERAAHVHAWKAAARFAALALWWRDNRVDGDAETYDALEAWRKQDKHLWEWEANARRKALARRRHEYRVTAAGLARRFGVLVVEKLNLARGKKRPDPEDPRYEERSDRSESQRTATAPGEFRQMLAEAFRARGGKVVEVPAAVSPEAMLLAYREGLGAVKESGTSRAPKWSRIKELAKEGVAATAGAA